MDNILTFFFFILLSVHKCFAQNKTVMYQRYEVGHYYNNITLNNSTEIIMDFRPEDNRPYPARRPARIHVECKEGLNETFPLFITASQQTLTSSWQLPMKIEFDSEQYLFYFSRTLCPTSSDSPLNWPLVHLTTENLNTLNVDITVKLLDEFDIPLANKSEPEDGWISTKVMVNTPKYYSFRFPAESSILSSNISTPVPSLALPKIKSPQTVILMLESNSPNCLIVSIQNLSCPVYDDEQTVKHKGDYFTMMEKGGITVSQTKYPVGFYVVLYLKASDDECTGLSLETNNLLHQDMEPYRAKPVRFRVIRTISYEQYVVAVFVVLASIVVYLILVGLISFSTRLCTKPTSIIFVDNPTSTIDSSTNIIDYPILEEDEDIEEVTAQSEMTEVAPLEVPQERPLTLADMCRVHEDARKSRADKFLWGVVVVSVFYSLPVVQLVVTYQQMAQQTGDQDLCYYNFLCAYPLGTLGDANHVFSNMGYLALGSLFLVLVRRRERKYAANQHRRTLGIPQHFGLYYAMGVSLIVEGFLSGTYHICPNKMNFQFDSSFMYVMSVLCMVKLYQSRHPDINVKAHVTFTLLACVIFIGFSEVLFTYSDTRSYSAYWLFLMHLKLLFMIWVSCKIYYMNDWKLSRCVAGASQLLRDREWVRRLRPARSLRFSFIVAVNLINYAFDMYGYSRARRRARDLPVHLLQVLLINSTLYIAIYIFMKLKHRERVTPKAIMSLVISNALWAVSLYFFINGRTKWAWTPARSRNRNAPCTLLDTLDTHDVWHFTSAAALFHTFLLLLTIDDDLRSTPREQIAVF